MGRVIMIASGKGGTGKSTMTVNLGMSLAFAGYHVLLMDMNTGLRTLDLYLGLENRALFDIGDVISGICGKENAILKFP
ncbi:MAG: P-loop NTPase, partial [Mogibacterium sp.]|nr:P-loop NTPase [Mogibacterium sp.]